VTFNFGLLKIESINNCPCEVSNTALVEVTKWKLKTETVEVEEEGEEEEERGRKRPLM
jgi:hypothetical protein